MRTASQLNSFFGERPRTGLRRQRPREVRPRPGRPPQPSGDLPFEPRTCGSAKRSSTRARGDLYRPGLAAMAGVPESAAPPCVPKHVASDIIWSCEHRETPEAWASLCPAEETKGQREREGEAQEGLGLGARCLWASPEGEGKERPRGTGASGAEQQMPANEAGYHTSPSALLPLACVRYTCRVRTFNGGSQKAGKAGDRIFWVTSSNASSRRGASVRGSIGKVNCGRK